MRIFLLATVLFSSLFAEPTSLSDHDRYRNVCMNAATKEKFFKKFRKSRTYRGIVEPLTFEEGQKYLEVIQQSYPHLLHSLPQFIPLDSLGSPKVYNYSIGQCSPLLLRYMKVLGDLETHFGTLNRMNIVEIGCGFGGQCFTSSQKFSIQSYSLIDLPEPLALIKKCLTTLGVSNFHCVSPEDLSDQSYDLVISNYAFSECNKAIQQIYLEKVIKNARHGYLTVNFMDKAQSQGRYSLDELVQILKTYQLDIKLIPEEPLTAPDNSIIIW